MRLTDEQIAAGLRALRPAPDEAFAAALDRRAASGFPALEPRMRPRTFRWNRLLPALAAVAAIGVVAVALSLGGGETPSSEVGQGRTGPAATSDGGSGAVAPQAAPSESVAPGTALPIQPVPPGVRPRNGRPQVQELSAALGLSTEAGKVQDAADGVVETTSRYDGFVDSSDVRVGGPNAHAFFTLRIPATHLRDALDDLSALGRVTSRDESSSNVTGAYVDAGKSYREARAKVNSLLEDLRKASSPSEAAAIRRQLAAARQELSASREALRGVKQRVTYAPVSVEIRANGDGSWSIGDAADDAVGVLEAIGGAALITLAVLLPLSALLALGWLGARELQRRRREATLDR